MEGTLAGATGYEGADGDEDGIGELLVEALPLVDGETDGSAVDAIWERDLGLLANHLIECIFPYKITHFI